MSSFFRIAILCIAVCALLFILFFTVKKHPNRKTTILLPIFIGIIIGLLAYEFHPAQSFDLTRHQEYAYSLSSLSISDFIQTIHSSDREIIPQIYSFLISKMGNINLLQFFIASLGYSSILYIIFDYQRFANLKILHFTLIAILAIFGQSMLYYFSGLYNYLAINLFAFAFYLDYIKKRKAFANILYCSLPFLHASMFFPIAILILFKLTHGKLNKKFIIPLLFIITFAIPTITTIVRQLDIPSVLSPAVQLLISYTTHNQNFHRFYHGYNMMLELIKLFFSITIYLFSRKTDRDMSSYNNFMLLFALVTLSMLPNAIVVIRFATLVLYISIIPLMNYFSKAPNNPAKHFLTSFTIILTGLCLFYNIHLIYPYEFQQKNEYAFNARNSICNIGKTDNPVEYIIQ